MKLSPRRAEVVSIAAFIIHIVFFVVAMLISRKTFSYAVFVEAWHILGGAIVWLILLIQFRQIRLTMEEEQDAYDYQRMRQEGKDTSVFDSAEIESTMFLAKRRLQWIEKYLIPAFSIVLSLYLIVIGSWTWAKLRMMGTYDMTKGGALLGMSAFLIGFALVTFLFSRYIIGLSQQKEWRALRSGGSYMLGNALANFAIAITLLFANKGYVLGEFVTSYVLVILITVIGIEIIASLILDFYRPRIKDQYHRAAYESRILGLFSEPGGVFRNAAHALDYQFGFKVSETWFYRLLERTVILIILVQVLILWLMSSITIVKPGNIGVIERTGKPINLDKPLQSGIHLKMPWPFDVVKSFPVDKIQVLEVGFKGGHGEEVYRESKALFWTVQHWLEEHPFLVAVKNDLDQDVSTASSDISQGQRSDCGLLVIGLYVHYRISDVSKYGYGENSSYTDPKEFIHALCYQEMVRFAAQSHMDVLMGPGRQAAADRLHGRVQEIVDRHDLGVDIIFLGFEAVHPPVEVAPDFEKVISAFQTKQQEIIGAEGQKKEIMSNAIAQKNVYIARAEATKFEREEIAEANAQRFKDQITAYEKGQNVYLLREYMSVLEEYLPAMRKYYYGPENVNDWVYELDLNEKLKGILEESFNFDPTDQEN